MRSGRTSELRVAGATLYPTHFHCKVRAVSEYVKRVPRARANPHSEPPGHPAGGRRRVAWLHVRDGTCGGVTARRHPNPASGGGIEPESQEFRSE